MTFSTATKKTILLTGGTGFFGKELLTRMIESNCWGGQDITVFVLSRDPERFLKSYPNFGQFPFISYIQGDVRTASIPDRPFDLILHAATEASAVLEQEDPEEMYSVIVEGTKNILSTAKRSGVRRFLYVSSGAVYGPQPPDLSHVPEDWTGMPNTAYGRGKLQAEFMVHEAADRDNFDCSIARCFAFIGPYLNREIHFAIGNFMRDGLNGDPIVIQGDGSPLRSYLYATDLADWLWTILFQAENHAVYNVGSDRAISILELANLVAQQFERPPIVQVLKTPDPSKPPARYVPDVSKIARELGLHQKISLEEGLRQTLTAIRNGRTYVETARH